MSARRALMDIARGALVVGVLLGALAWFAATLALLTSGHYIAGGLLLVPFGLFFCWLVGQGIAE